MSESNEVPDWGLLPRRPREFFGLPREFDDKQLKRAYNQLIRRYKPERHAQEFQQIRAAFEALRQPRHMFPQIVGSWPAPARNPNPHPNPNPTPKEERVTNGLDARTELGAVPASEVYRRLRQTTPKSPHHYRQLALLADVAPHPGEESFAGWIVEGLGAFPSDLALARLLCCYCERGVAIDEAPTLLRHMASRAPSYVWHPMTQPLWLQLAREGPFSEFRELFDRLIGAFENVAPEACAAATVQILPWVVLDADEEWLMRVWQDIHGQNGPPSLRYNADSFDDIDRLEVMLRYRGQRRAFLDGSAPWQRIDEIVRTVIEGPRARAESAVTAWRVETAADPAPLLRSIPSEGVDLSAAYLLLAESVHEIDSRHEPTHKSASSVVERAERVLTFVEARTARSALGMLGLGLWIAALVVVPMALIAVTWSVASKADEAFGTVGFAVVLAVLGLVSYVVWDRRVRRSVYPQVDRWHGRLCHRRLWRNLVAREMVAQLVPRTAVVAQGQAPHRARWCANWLCDCISRDWGLAFVGLTQPSWNGDVAADTDR